MESYILHYWGEKKSHFSHDRERKEREPKETYKAERGGKETCWLLPQRANLSAVGGDPLGTRGGKREKRERRECRIGKSAKPISCQGEARFPATSQEPRPGMETEEVTRPSTQPGQIGGNGIAVARDYFYRRTEKKKRLIRLNQRDPQCKRRHVERRSSYRRIFVSRGEKSSYHLEKEEGNSRIMSLRM